MKNIITVAAIALAVISGGVAVNNQVQLDKANAKLAEAEVQLKFDEVYKAENEELWASADNLMGIICDNADESWRPMCQEEDAQWELVVDEEMDMKVYELCEQTNNADADLCYARRFAFNRI